MLSCRLPSLMRLSPSETTRIILQHRQQNVFRRRVCFQHTSSTKKPTQQSTAEYLKQANDTMSHYSHARQLYRMGKIEKRPQPKFAIPFQAVVIGLFLVAFAATPFLGKKIATDPDFRKQYVPAWYDCTVQQPEGAWTRDELHAQLVAVQKELSERAQRGDFSDSKLQDIEQNLGDNNNAPSHPKQWDQIHPGLAEGESYNEA